MAKANQVAETETVKETKRSKRGSTLLAQAKSMFFELVVALQSDEGVSDELFDRAVALREKFPATQATMPPDVKLASINTRITELSKQFVNGLTEEQTNELRNLLNQKQRIEKAIANGNADGDEEGDEE